MTDAILVALILGPAAITYLLKSDAALGFLTLCLGFVLSTSVIGDLKQLLSQADLSVTESTLALILLVVPLVVTLLLVHSGKRRGIKLWLQLLVALAAGGLLALSVGPILSGSSQFDVSQSGFWGTLVNLQSVIIGAGAFLSLTLIWFNHGRKSKKH